MKYKLSGLLMFSQAAACGSDVFTPTTIGVNTVNKPAQWLIDSQSAIISSDYQVFCGAQTDYLNAVEKAKTSRGMTMKPCPGSVNFLYPSACVTHTNTAYTQACQKLSADKAQMPDAWNAAVKTMGPCNNIR
jgi:hypothetical protein